MYQYDEKLGPTTDTVTPFLLLRVAWNATCAGV
jgi:hypothetical protein